MHLHTGFPSLAVDGNVLRVVSRVLCSDEDIMKQSVRRKVEALLEEVIPEDAASDFNQGLIELGALVCVPNGEPKCGECPLQNLCRAHAAGREAGTSGKDEAKNQADCRAYHIHFPGWRDGGSSETPGERTACRTL